MVGEGEDGKALGLAEVAADDVRSQLGDLLNRAGFLGERIIITRHGKPVVALVSVEDVKRLVGEAA